MKRNYDVAAYIWPSYHHEPRVEHFWPEKDGEWYTVRRGTPRFPGHDMPRIPLLGCQDEADPKVMRQHVELALAHGINVFIMDWYWYANAPCFERQLNEGLIPALEGTDAKFYLMWANHDVNDLWNMHVDTYWDRPQKPLWSGQVNRAELEPMFDRIIEKYLPLDSYYRIGGKPVFSIFDYANLVTGLGGVAPTRDAFDWMRKRCVARGLPGLDIQAIARSGAGVEAGAKLEPGSEQQTARDLAFDSATAYQYVRLVHTGDQVFFAGGENMSYTGSDDIQLTNHVYKNGLDIGCHTDSYEKIKSFNPTWIATGHTDPYPVNDGFFDGLEKGGKAFDSVHNALMPLGDDDIHFGAESQGGKLKHYHAHHEKAGSMEFWGWVLNPYPTAQTAYISIAAPVGWSSESITIELGPREQKEFSISLAPPANTTCRRLPVGLNLIVGGRPFGQVAEALVTIGHEFH
ncbi:MAG: glycoside hydrolase family 99-like domain-containing protein [Verrucomicrobia bacterium]|nr:glycoside hydrolase family 99-like domain-containing protein [Verrucomicrobiota bacterium]